MKDKLTSTTLSSYLQRRALHHYREAQRALLELLKGVNLSDEIKPKQHEAALSVLADGVGHQNEEMITAFWTVFKEPLLAHFENKELDLLLTNLNNKEDLANFLRAQHENDNEDCKSKNT
jgi:hypothetical protein